MQDVIAFYRKQRDYQAAHDRDAAKHVYQRPDDRAEHRAKECAQKTHAVIAGVVLLRRGLFAARVALDALAAGSVQLHGRVVDEQPALRAVEGLSAAGADIRLRGAAGIEYREEEIEKLVHLLQRADGVVEYHHDAVVHSGQLSDAVFFLIIHLSEAREKFALRVHVPYARAEHHGFGAAAVPERRGIAAERTIGEAVCNFHAVFIGKLFKSGAYHIFSPRSIILFPAPARCLPSRSIR